MAVKKPTSPVKGSTQNFTEVLDIQDDILLLKDYSACCVIEVGAVNFWLLSAEEQSSMIYAYGSLLNSLSFPVQIVILSKRTDISEYISYVYTKISQTPNELLQRRLNSYREFIKSIVKQEAILEKRFFFVVPFNALELGLKSASGMSIKKEYIFARAKTSLYPKRDNMLRLLAKVGLRATVLQEQELVESFLNLYNPSSTGRSLAPVQDYTQAIMTVG